MDSFSTLCYGHVSNSGVDAVTNSFFDRIRELNVLEVLRESLVRSVEGLETRTSHKSAIAKEKRNGVEAVLFYC